MSDAKTTKWADRPQKAAGAAKRPKKALTPALAPEAAQKAKEAATKAYINAIGIQDIETAIAENRQQQQIEALAPKKIGRPSTRTPEVVKEICDRLSSGEPLRAICRDPRMPGWDTVYDWMARDEGFALQVAQARENGVEAIAQDTLAMIDAEPRYVEDAKGGTRIDAGYVQWLKLRTEQRMKLLACWSPNRYGNRVQVAGDKENPLQINIQATEMFDSILKNAEMTRQIEE
jgi:transposase